VLIESPGPIQTITVADDTSFQVKHANFSRGQIYPANLGPADAGFFVRLDTGQVVGIDIAGRDAVFHTTAARATKSVGWSPISLTLAPDGLSATLAAQIPALAGIEGLSVQLTQVTSYTPGSDLFRIVNVVTNGGDSPVSFDAFAAADIYIANSDWGVGYYDEATGAVGGVSFDGLYAILLTADTSAGIAPTSHQEGRYRDLWTIIGGGDGKLGLGKHFDNTVLLPSQSPPYYTDPAFKDTGIGLEWQSIRLLPGESSAFAYSFSFGTAPPSDPMPKDGPPGDTPGKKPPFEPLFAVGGIAAASDRGSSSADAITNDNQPRFQGQATAGATLTLTAIAQGGGATLTAAPVTVTADGTWSATFAGALPDGQFTINATITRDGEPAYVTTLHGAASRPLVIDTVGPRVTGLRAALRARRIVAAIEDDLAGLETSALGATSNYDLSFGTARRRGWVALAAGVEQPASPTAPATITLIAKRRLDAKRYVLTISDTIRDIAGNALDGEFRRTLPSGDHHPGSVFQASLRRRGLALLAIEPVGELRLAAVVRARKRG
jgi:hypothetical protein